MAYFYPANKAPSNVQVNVWNMNGTKAYLKHFDNPCFLDLVSTKGTWAERQDVAREIHVCHQKLEWWSKHPKFDPDEARRGVEQLLKNWQIGAKSQVRLMLLKAA